MEPLFVGLDVSKDETAICVRTHNGIIQATFKKPTDPDMIHRALIGNGTDEGYGAPSSSGMELVAA